ncbi:BON1-associated protein 2-like [Ipomoea triloba]|uniref:BON1-associated protein 2-like n=1 Tax=Ipomoea triloba TaxID=35885 RepID=UPI00125CDFAB|nr:BON1-associated protein 2-like [Ipomoea triloba]
MMSRTLEVTVISGEDLRVSRSLPVKKNAFVTVRADSGDAQNTGMEKQGGEGYVAWNQKLTVHLPMHAHYLTLEVQCKTFSGKKCIGVARIPTSDFVGGMLPENYLHFLSYRLRDSHGERNGIINISIVVKEPAITRVTDYSRPCTGVHLPVPVPNSGAVTGIPVWTTW